MYNEKERINKHFEEMAGQEYKTKVLEKKHIPDVIYNKYELGNPVLQYDAKGKYSKIWTAENG